MNGFRVDRNFRRACHFHFGTVIIFSFSTALMFASLRAFSSHHHYYLRRSQPLSITVQLRRMSAEPQASRVRVAPDSDVELARSKKPRLASDTTAEKVQDYTSPQTRPKSELQSKKSKRKSKNKKFALPEACSPEDVLWHEIKSVLGPSAVEKAIEEGVEYESPFAFHEEVEVVVKSLSPSGEFSCSFRWRS